MTMNLEFIRRETEVVAIEVGSYLKEEQVKLSKNEIEFKGERNYVTYIDKEAEKRTIEGLSKVIPEAGFLVEEETVEYEEKPYVWIVDPLDGTSNYIHNNTPYVVSIALMHEDKIVLGVVYDPVLEELFSATSDSVTTLNGSPISVSKHSTIRNGFIGFGIPYKPDNKSKEIIQRASLHFSESGFRIKGAAAAELCYVAAGRYDAFFHSGLAPWDVAAGAIIVQQVGGIITDYSGGKNFLHGREVIAPNKLIYEELMTRIIN